MSEIKNIDGLLSQQQTSVEEKKIEEPIQEIVEEVKAEEIEKPKQEEQSYDTNIQLQDSKPEESTVDEDEYGNKPGKQKVYTEEEVQRMIRERLARGRYAEQQVQQAQPVQQQTAQQQPEGQEGWQAELETFIDQTLQKRQKQQHEQNWRQQEQRIQQEFEDKFTSGMSKYSDFREVVASQPITDTMLLAVRNMSDPAAFIYAASKTQPKELERIAKIGDPLHQAAELGRLDVQMKKIRNKTTNAPKPISVSKGDVSGTPKRSLDDLIRIDATRKFRR